MVPNAELLALQSTPFRLDGWTTSNGTAGQHHRNTYLSKKDAASYLGLSVRCLNKHLAGMPRYRIGKKLLFRKSALDNWMEQFKEEPRMLDLRRLLDDALKQARRNVERRRAESRKECVILQNKSQKEKT
jgi:excisionase family DNA binding protein